jgi:prepilin-type N-terminal cleavage/methylation domain-containing protein
MLDVNTVPQLSSSYLGNLSGASKRGFSLVELLVVIAIMAILLGLTAPSLSGLMSSGNMNVAVSDISDLLSQSRSYAMAHNTYVWVGFSEQANQKLMVGVVAGKSGQSSDLTLPGDPTASVNYIPIAKPQSFDHFSLQAVSSLPTLTGMATVGDDISAPQASPNNSFTQNNAGTPITFSKIIQFSPQGEASVSSSSTAHWVQIGIEPMRGATANTANVAVFQVASLTGQVRVFRQ